MVACSAPDLWGVNPLFVAACSFFVILPSEVLGRLFVLCLAVEEL